MKKKLKVGILFGGKSFEHEVSLLSARSVVEALDKDKYEPVLIGIDKNGQWHLHESADFILHADNPKLVKLNKANGDVALLPGTRGNHLVRLSSHGIQEDVLPCLQKPVDVIFPVMHGIFGEDGTLQGLLKLADIPFVGAGVLGSSVGMDKDVMKRLLRDAGLNIGKFLAFNKYADKPEFDKIVKEIGLPFFVKPANSGSSVGIHKVKSQEDFKKAAADAFRFDVKIICEEFIQGREIECSVLGNEHPEASVPGEVIPHHEFYSYEAKYIDDKGASLEIPAKLPPDITENVRTAAVAAYKILCCEGMGRVDFFVTDKGKVYVNEINTIPGFTKISMYPKMWEASGIKFSELIDRLIALALDRFEKEKQLKTSYNEE